MTSLGCRVGNVTWSGVRAISARGVDTGRLRAQMEACASASPAFMDTEVYPSANAQDPPAEPFQPAEWTDPDQIRLYRLLTATAMGVQPEEYRLNAAGFRSTTQAKTRNLLAAPRPSQSPSLVPSGAAANPYEILGPEE